MRLTAAALSAELIAEQRLRAVSHAVVVGFDDAWASGLVHELDQSLLGDRAHEVRVHRPGLRHHVIPGAVWDAAASRTCRICPSASQNGTQRRSPASA